MTTHVIWYRLRSFAQIIVGYTSSCMHARTHTHSHAHTPTHPHSCWLSPRVVYAFIAPIALLILVCSLTMCYLPCTNILSSYKSVCFLHTYTHGHRCTRWLTLTHTYTHSHSLTHTHTHTHTYTLTLSHSHIHIHTHTHSHTHTHTHTHTHSHTHTAVCWGSYILICDAL